MRLLYFFLALTLIGLNSCQDAAPYKRVYLPTVEVDSTPIRVSNYIQNFSGSPFNGVILVAKKGELMLSEGYGKQNNLKKQQFASNTPVHIGALGKQFTAAAILQLELQGLLEVGDSLQKYFDNIPADKQYITIHNLLTHTAGLSANINEEQLSMEKWLNTVALESSPGQTFKYSNAGYHLLAKIIEQVSGHSYTEYLNLAIFRPLGMHQTTIQDSNWAYSTADDMYQWYMALRGEDFLPQNAKDKFFQAYIPEGKNALVYYAYGWTVDQSSWQTPILRHNSTHTKGYTEICYYPKDDAFVFIATDQENSGTAQFSQEINHLTFKLQSIPAPPTTTLALDQLPKNEEGQQLAKLLDTLANGQSSEMEELIQDYFAPSLTQQLSLERHLSILQHIQQEINQAELETVERLGESNYRLTLKDPKNASKNILWIELAPKQPFSVTNFSIDTVRG